MSDHRNESAPAGDAARGAGGDTGREAVQRNCSTAAAAGNPPVTTAAGPMLTLPPPLAALAEEPTFCLYKTSPHPDKPGKLEKRPCNHRGEVCDANDPANHMGAELACQWAAHYGPPYGVAKVFPPGGRFFFLDIDDCWVDGAEGEEGQWSPIALTLCDRFAGCAVEVSTSGRGLHIFGRGPVPDHGCTFKPLGLELYTEKRFVALTGTGVVGDAGHTPDPAAIRWLVDSYFPPRGGSGSADRGADWTDGPCPEWRGPTDDAELLRRAMRSQSGKAALFGKAGFADLWEARADVLAATYPADASGSGAYNASSADMALAQHLAFWTGRDCERIERLMRQSALVREKWDDRKEYYLPLTIRNAAAGCRDVLHDREVEPAMPTPPALLPGKPRFQSRTPDDLSALPPVKYRVKGVLPETGIAAIYGPSGVGKTFVILDMGFNLAGASASWFNYRVRPAPVTYVALEGEAGIAQRVTAWQKHHGKAPGNFRVVTGALDIRREADRTELAEIILDAGMAGGVVIIDTLNQAAPGADENASTDMGLIVAALKDLQARLGGLVLVVHHSGKDAARGLRGHSSLLAALDASIEVTRDGDRREWKVAKAKDGVDGIAHPFRLLVVPLGFDEDGEPITSCVIAPDEMPGEAVRRAKVPTGGNQKIIWDALTELLDAEGRRTGGRKPEGAPDELPLGRTCLLVEDAVHKCRDRLPSEPKRKTERARDAINRLITGGLLECREGWLWKI